jgi:2-desacetyl-2-hydroxyethyl bacteriochlorophyllide A dehydrogenase
MKAAKLFGPRDIRYVDVDRPVPGRGGILIRVKAVGLCGTDLEVYNGTMPYLAMGWAKYPMILGHEWSGIVEEVGEGVSIIKKGDRVTGDVSIGCGKCAYCLRGFYNLCLERTEVGLCRGKDGAYAEFLTMPERHCYRLPEGVSFEEGAVVEATATVVKAINKTGIALGDITVVQGDGPIGLLALQAAQAAGSAIVILAGTFPEKLRLGRTLGADVTVNVKEENLRDVVGKFTDGIGADVVLEACGKAEAVVQATEAVRAGGKICLIGVYETPVSSFNASIVVTQDINLYGSIASPNAFIPTLRLMKSGKIKTAPLISHRLPLSKIAEGMRILEKEIATRNKIVMIPE